MENRIYIASLFDVYGGLLNERQKEIMRMRLLFDYSLSEIGEELNISRQAVHDAEKKSIESLKYYEKTLSIIKKQIKFKEVVLELKKKILFADIHTSDKDILLSKINELEEEID